MFFKPYPLLISFALMAAYQHNTAITPALAPAVAQDATGSLGLVAVTLPT